MNRIAGYLKVGMILFGIYGLFTREYLCLAVKRLGHRVAIH